MDWIAQKQHFGYSSFNAPGKMTASTFAQDDIMHCR